MQTKVILFDIDGTLVESNDMHVLAWEEAFAGIGERFDRQVVHDQIGKRTDMLVPTLLPDLDEDAQEKLGEVHGAVFKANFLKEAKPFPKAHDLLAHAHRCGQQVVLASLHRRLNSITISIYSACGIWSQQRPAAMT